jgi:hypothetical protein
MAPSTLTFDRNATSSNSASKTEILESVLDAVSGPRTRLPELQELLLGVLTYSYCIGLYDSEEISYRISELPASLVNSLPECITAGHLRRFRRANRTLLRATLSTALRNLWQRGLTDSPIYPPDFDGLAEDRIQSAIRWDSWAADGSM